MPAASRAWIVVVFGCFLLSAQQNGTTKPDQIAELRARIAAQEKQIQALQDAVREQKAMLDRLDTPASSAPVAAVEATVAPPRAPEHEGESASPLGVKIGRTTFTPGGFLDMTMMYRSTNVGSGTPTSFGTIPFDNTVAGNLSETRFSAQHSRVSLKIGSVLRGLTVTGYIEADFLGNAPPNLAVSSNSGTLRLRQYYVNVEGRHFSILGGQAWSLMTPGRRGITADPGDVFNTRATDPNYQLGLTWSRDPQLRFVWKPRENTAVGLSIESPEQYNGGFVTYPRALQPPYSLQFDEGAAASKTPNPMPDFIGKLALDRKWWGGRDVHFETVGLVRQFRTYNPLSGVHFSQMGFGGSVNGNLQIAGGLHALVNTFASSGGGRYVFGLGPDAVVNADGDLSPVHGYSGVAGFEYYRGTKNPSAAETVVYGYYGGAYFQRVIVLDPGGPPVGFGFPGSSPNTSNRNLHEGTAGVNRTIWRDPNYGVLRLMTQYSYVLRTPWWLPPGNPKNAKTNMVYVTLRYELP